MDRRDPAVDSKPYVIIYKVREGGGQFSVSSLLKWVCLMFQGLLSSIGGGIRALRLF